jgi:hypothetical protein
VAGTDVTDGRVERRLGLTALAYVVMHHVGSLPGGLGEVGVTRWSDWIDLLTPYAVLLPAAGAMVAGAASRRTWAVFAVGALAYAQGHGIHLSANSVHNVAPGDAAHLWDEVVGHLVWYAGVALVTCALATVSARRPLPARRVAGTAVVLAVAVGLTWASNAVGGGTLWFALPFALGVAGYGTLHRDRLAAVLLPGYLCGAVLLVAELTR